MLVSTIIGDPFPSLSLVLAFPTVLENSKYSREFEADAHDYVYDYLLDNNLLLTGYANIFERITEMNQKKGLKIICHHIVKLMTACSVLDRSLSTSIVSVVE